MSQQCPYCAAPLPEQEGGAAETAMVCPLCGAQLTADLVSPTLDAGPDESSDGDELVVDFSLADDELASAPSEEPAAAPSEEPVVDEQAIEWLDETPLAAETPAAGDTADRAEPMEADFELASGESAEEFFGLEELESTPPAAEGPGEDADLLDLELEPEVPVRTVAPLVTGADDSQPVAAMAAAATADVMEPSARSEPPTKKRKGILARLLGGVMLAAGLLLGAAVLQLLCWWIVRIDPLNTTFMVPKSIGFLVPRSLTEEGRLAALQVTVRQDPAEGYAEDEEEELPAGTEATAPPDGSTAPDEPAVATDTTADDTSVAEMPTPEPSPDAVVPEVDAAADDLLASQPEEESRFVPTTMAEEQPPAEDMSFAAGDTGLDNPLDDAMAPAGEAGEDAPVLADEPAEDLFGFDDTPMDDASDPMVETEPEPAPLITNVPVFRAADVRSATAVAAEATRQLNEAKRNRVERDQLKEIARDFYTSLSELAETGTLVESGTAVSELDDARNLLEKLAQDASKLRMIGGSSVGWLASRLGDGIVVSGTVESSQTVGNFQEVTVRPTGRDETLVVVTPRDLPTVGNVLTVGKNVLLGGYIVRNPSLQLPDYLSTANEVIWTNDLVVATP